MNWTREHEIVTLDLYCRIPFNKANNSNRDIQNLARILGRTVNSVKMKIGNFGSFDPELKRLGIVGLAGTSQLDEDIWKEYYNHWDKLAFDARQILATYSHTSIEAVSDIDPLKLPPGRERERVVKQRINQSFFRNAVLSSYSMQCCITGLKEVGLLEAAHIVSWADDEANRTNPTNGLCMNALMHRAYDRFLITISPDYQIYVSDSLIESEKNSIRQIEYFRKLKGQKILLPNRFLPSKEFLEQHYEKFKNIV